MKISEIQAQLQKILDEHGDLPIYFWDDWTETQIQNVDVTTAGISIPFDRVVLHGMSKEQMEDIYDKAQETLLT